ncbi:MAG TPA: hypothetical protein VHE30_29640 [Polyangiaceae bacterium]|nr:hypothetical protein [Polyangiaceae bacterium]
MQGPRSFLARRVPALLSGAVSSMAVVACESSSDPYLARGVGTPPDAGAHVTVPDAATRDVTTDTDGGTAGRDASRVEDASPADAGTPDADSGSHAADGGPDATDAGHCRVSETEAEFARASVRKRIRGSDGTELVLEEELVPFTSTAFPKTRVVSLGTTLEPRWTWPATPGTYISDFCRHPSGDVSVALVGDPRAVSLVRLDSELAVLAVTALHDPDIANDPHSAETGVTDLVTAALALDPVRVVALGEDVRVVAIASTNSVLGYRMSYHGGKWSTPARTLIEPASGITPFLPIGGSFDTFGAIGAWFRPSADVDDSGDTYVAVWADRARIRNHVASFQDGLVPLFGNPAQRTGDSDILLTKLGPDGTRLWTRVVGSEFEDEPYALRATNEGVAVVGRARRFPGFDNTAWDGLLSVTSASGEAAPARTFPLDQSSIFLGVDARPGGGWVVGGSDGWTQNPDGLSILSFGKKLLLELPEANAAPIRRVLPAGPRHSELHTVLADDCRISYAGHEDGPLTHSGDSDPSAVFATGVLGEVRTSSP